MAEGDPGEVTAAAIARRLGLGRAAVTNWRRRYEDFPKPVSHGPSPRFVWSDVEKWLLATGKGDQLAAYGRTDTGTQLLDRAGGSPPDDVAPLTPSEFLAQVMVSLLPTPAEGQVLLDPVCGAGERLLAAADRFGPDVVLEGHDDDEAQVELARARLRHHPGAGDYEVETTPPRRQAAAVVCLSRGRPPAGAASDDPAGAWALRCADLLRPHGTAVVGVPASVATRSSGISVRTDLVRRGLLRLVVGLPSSVGAADLHLWVLRQTLGRGEDVSMVDVSAVADPTGLPLSREGWDRLLDDADPALVRRVPRVALLDGVTDLDPAHHAGTQPGPTAQALTDLTVRLRTVYGQVAAVLHPPVAASTRGAHELVGLAELERRGALTIMPRESSPHAGDVVLRGRVPTVADDRDDVAAQVIAIDPERLDAHFVALFLRPEVESLTVTTLHGAPSRADLRRCRLPRLSLPEQRRYGDAHRRLLELQNLTSGLARTTTAVLDRATHGLTSGALRPTGPTRPRTEGDPA